MPSSYVDNVPPIVHAMIAVAPKRVCDVGPGWGKFGLMAREYLPELERIEAVEVPEGEKHTQWELYDAIAWEDVRSLEDRFWQEARYDLVLMIDVIEHMTLMEGRKLLRTILASGAKVLVSTPKIWIEQDDLNNPYEKHVSFWGNSETFCEFQLEKDISTINSVIFLLGGMV